jgi:hypothetical protein
MDSLLFLIDSYEPIVLKDITNFSSSVVSNNQANIEKVIIGSSVVSLEDYCFENCINMVYVYIPGTVSIIGANCFRGCINLNEVLISRGVKILGEACFKGCKNLTHFKIPLTITHIYSNCFEDCINLNEIAIQKQQNIIYCGNDIFKNINRSVNIIFNYTKNSYYLTEHMKKLISQNHYAEDYNSELYTYLNYNNYKLFDFEVPNSDIFIENKK